MATIDDLPNRALTDMSDDELRQRLLEIRHARRVSPKPAVRAKATASKPRSAPKQLTPDQLLMQLASNPEAVAALIKKLEGSK